MEIKADGINRILGRLEIEQIIKEALGNLSREELRSQDYTINIDLSNRNIDGANLSGMDLSEANLDGASLKNVNFREAKLESTNLSGARLDNADLRGAGLYRANLSGACLDNTDLRGADLREANLSGVDLTKTHLKGINLKGTVLKQVNLSNVDLSTISLAGSNLTQANLSGANLNKANLGPTINKYPTILRYANLSKANLSEAFLVKADLSWADLREANLNDAVLREAILNRAKLNHAFLRKADLSKAQLRLAILRDADLTEADLSNANLHEADLSGADLTDVDQYGANLSGTILSKEEGINSSQIENIAKADPANIQEVAASQLAINSKYYESVLQQSQRSFLSALIWASIGTLLIIAAVVFLLIRQPSNLSYVSLIGGAVVETIAGLNFYLYGRASNQLTTFQLPLDRIGRFLIANSVCENLEGDIKHITRAKLVETIANVPLSTNGKENEEMNIAPQITRALRSANTRTLKRK